MEKLFIQIILIWSSVIMMINATKTVKNVAIVREKRSSLLPTTTTLPSSSSSSSSMSLENLNINNNGISAISPATSLTIGSFYRPFTTTSMMSTLVPYIPHQNIYPIPYQSSSLSSMQPSAISLYASPLITTLQWNPQRNPIAFTATMPIFAHYITTTTANNHPYNVANIDKNMFQKRIDNSSSNDNNNNNDQSVPCKTSSFPISSSSSQAINRPLASSETYPVYVLPPKDFQPIIYQQPSSLASFFTPLPLIYQQQNKLDRIPEEVWYDISTNSEKNLKSSITKSNQIDKIEQFDKNKITLIPVDEANFDNIPLLEASASTVKQVNSANDTIIVAKNNVDNDKIDKSSYPTIDIAINPYSSRSNDVSGNPATIINLDKSRKTTSLTFSSNINKSNNNINQLQNEQRWPYKTKLPVGLSSFFLGGTRGVSGRHWNLPSNIQKQLEFMPNLIPSIISNNEYYPDQSITDPIVDKNEHPEPEKEDTDYDNQHSKTITKNLFNMNTVVDREEDLDAQESKIIITMPQKR
ncbi:uncharacterized protein LOC113789864 [Dermatophagoides pteronyssinus]|uniref:uncharacterized protein LOC113789864 n=1 Tax=Dermatophagoides pteronyssinus TaxID=6956 RepID=UPI003F66F566